MLTRRAVLIQCIVEYVSLILPYIRKAVRKIDLPIPLNEKEIIKWVIEEELELIYGLFTHGHQHGLYPYELIHNRLELSIPAGLSRTTAAYIKGPKLYSNNNIKIELSNFDLIIEYYTDSLIFNEGFNKHGLNRNNKDFNF